MHTDGTARREETPLIPQSARKLGQQQRQYGESKNEGGRRGSAGHDDTATGRRTLDAGARLRKPRELMMAEENRNRTRLDQRND